MKIRKPIVTIDGPAGAGKTSSAKALAARLGLAYLDTGGVYRTIAYACKPCLDIMTGGDDEAKTVILREILETGIVMDTAAPSESGATVFFFGDKRLDTEIRTAEISMLSSDLSTYKPVREAAGEVIRSIAAKGGLVVEGRDTGTALFPDAEVKFYLKASTDKRAMRRYKQTPGQYASLYEAAQDTIKRDKQDSGRSLDPLRCPDGAIVVDNTNLTLNETVDRLYIYASSVLKTE